MNRLRECTARPIPHEVLWPALAGLIAVVLLIGLGVTTVAAPPAGASMFELAFALAPALTWTVASMAIGRFVRDGLIRQGLLISPASSLLIAGGLVITGAFCVMPYEFLLSDLAGLGFDVVVPLWIFGVMLLVGALVAHVLALGVDPREDQPAR